ncbi:MAG TPA: HD-GYP domain-containing protein [Actinomycetota bacterium]
MAITRIKILVPAVLLGGGAAIAWHARGAGSWEAGALALVAAAFISGLMLVEISSVSAETVTFALVAAALVQFGPEAAVAAAAAGEIGSALRPPRPKLHRSAFNVAAHALAAAGLGALFVPLVGGSESSAIWAAVVLPGSLLYFGISSGLVSLAIGWSTKAMPLEVWRWNFRWLVPHYPALAVVGIVLAMGQRAAGNLGVLVFCVPLLMSHYSVEVFVRKTRDQVGALEAANVRLSAVNAGLTETLASVVDARDMYLYRHSHAASGYTERIARRMALPEEDVQLAKQGALLHDIGKVGIPEAILRKPAALDDDERSIMNSHSEIGSEILLRTHELSVVAAIVRAHHERYDGKGYPDGLTGSEIPVGARIVAVLEAFDAMISDRPYRKGRPIDEALEEIHRCSGTQFDPRVVKAFLGVVREQGTGWLSNSAGGSDRDGEDLFLPKGLVATHHHDPSRDTDSDVLAG